MPGRALRFDVSDARNQKRVRHRAVEKAFASVETDHRAFLYWPPRRLVVVVDDSLFTISTGGVKENGLRSFVVRNWVSFDRDCPLDARVTSDPIPKICP